MSAGPGSALRREILEQPDALRRVLEREPARTSGFAATWARRGDIASVLLAGRGTSDNVARYAQYVLGAYNELSVGLATPSLFTRYRRPPRLDGMLVGAISQSGRSPDVVGVVREANAQGRPTLAITNDATSELAVEADEVIDLHAGPERSVAATKTYTSSLAAVAALSIALGLARDPASMDTARGAELETVPDRVGEAIEVALRTVVVPDWLVDAPACAVIGRGFNYATAFETALKVKELTAVPADAYSSADLLHGPIAAVRGSTPAVLVVPSGTVAPDVIEVGRRLRSQGTRLVVVSDREDALELADLALPIPADVPEWLSPLTAIVPGQILAWRLAVARGMDVDRPEGLQKVTETR